jgi:AcrR family transcriptional regulator
MSRWEPNAEGRFRAAALELFAEIGYAQTTVAAIAERAGLTARTFFRYFADKREVLFSGSEKLQQTMVDALSQVPAQASALDALAAALTKAGDFFDEERRPFARLRSSVITANPDLHERELIKMATLSAALAQALRERRIEEPDASLLAETGIAVLRIAFAQWVGVSEQRGYVEIMNETLSRLRTNLAGVHTANFA